MVLSLGGFFPVSLSSSDVSLGQEGVSRGHKHFTDDFFGDLASNLATDALAGASFTLPLADLDDSKGKAEAVPSTPDAKMLSGEDPAMSGKKSIDLASFISKNIVALSHGIERATVDLRQEYQEAASDLANPEVAL